jgi:putative NADH-flavin reductase
LVDRALESGHEIRAAVRDPERFRERAGSRLGDRLAHVEIVRADVLNPTDLEAAVQGADAVVSVIGPSKNGPPGMMQRAGANIAAAMERSGVKRLIAMTGAGVRFPQDKPAFMDKFVRFLLKTLQPAVLNDSVRYVDELTRDNLDWTIVRGPMLHDAPPKDSYTVGYVGQGPGPRASRENIAQFIVDELEAGRNIQDAPMISD